MADWTTYFEGSNPPEKYDENRTRIQEFVSRHSKDGRRLVLVTSGGTRVPLESRTVRFIDNFSVGTRGSVSAENFLAQGYAVIFLHRLNSLEPFTRHFSRVNFLDLLSLTTTAEGSADVQVDPQHTARLVGVLQRYQQVKETGTLLSVSFLSLSDYLYLLRAAAEAFSHIGPAAMLYLAAAVSDFYIPHNELPEHKIQSANGPLQITMQMTPKMLSPLVKEWAPQAFTVSFKLETDTSILIKKAKQALQKYSHQVVIANILETRKKTVTIVTRQEEQVLLMSDSELEAGMEIEEKIIADLVKRHEKFCQES
ncbi:PREDICTED: phosphopantothenate--cysteine ligase-like [Branchiostoma belcheri]|uniref:Phosphopantothenate--cysteine ligase n=1 Tax=Branchiostoma belcheri TaxID=7741 RepID=A0A6P4ZE13_BRABE|nr:PREDICTED: phosphopantothenate--cysteine ligase-like [Branchiostoma belcheri]